MGPDVKVKSAHLKNFTSFEDVEIDFSPGINVIIGENSTGKTHLLKLVYAIIKADETIHKSGNFTLDNKGSVVAGQLKEYFKPDELGRLAKRGRGSSADVKVVFDLSQQERDRCYHFSFTNRARTRVEIQEIVEINNPSSLYIPAIDMLTISEGFMAAYENRETAYDRTFYDLAVALETLPLRGPRVQEIKELIEPLEEETRLRVTKENGRFYLSFDGSSSMEAPLVAEGMKKLGMLIYLINNGSIGRNSILFWDEPEAHLNPKYIKIVVGFLLTLARRGVQVFVATHDYLLSQRLSQEAERNPSEDLLRFISLYNEEGATKAEVVPNLSEMQRNPILDEFALYADEEEKALYDELNNDTDG